MKDSHISVSRMFTQKGLCVLWKGGHKTILKNGMVAAVKEVRSQGSTEKIRLAVLPCRVVNLERAECEDL